jgi:hypothetical protein
MKYELLGLGRAFFWTGLSIMFAYMSYSRLLRTQQAITRENRAIARSQRELGRLQQEASEAVRLYGADSEEARNAIDAYQDAQERLREQEEDLRYATEQSNLAMAMFAFGTVPSAIRTVTDLIPKLQHFAMMHFLSADAAGAHAAALGAETVSEEAEAIAAGTSAAVTEMEAGAHAQAGIAAYFHAGGLALVKGGLIGLAIAAAIASAAIVAWNLYEQQSAQASSKAKEAIDDQSKALAGSGLEEAYRKTTSAVRDYSEALGDLDKGKSPTLGLAPNEGIMRDITPRGAGSITNIGPVYIYATVKSEEDAQAIARAIEGIALRDQRSYGEVL